MNKCLIDRRPYFFKHRYEDSKKEYDRYVKSRQSICCAKFGMGIKQLRNIENKTEQQEKWIEGYDAFCPLIESDSAMNLICKYMQGIEKDVRNSIKNSEQFNPAIYMDDSQEDWRLYEKAVVKCYNRFVRERVKDAVNKGIQRSAQANVILLRQALSYVCSNPIIVTNCLVHYLLIEKKIRSLDLLWNTYGKYMVKNADKNRHEPLLFPFHEANGAITYLGKSYEMKEVQYDD